jgi:hypothetical protein
MGTLSQIEKAPLQSKKFIAYIVSNLGSKLLIFWMVSKGEGDIVIMSTITAASFIDIGYILGQAALDKYVRVASLGKKGPDESA